VELLSATGASYDVIFCDLMMPDTDGVDLHRYVAEKFPGLEKRMVFISGGAFTPRAQDFLARIDTPRLEKPFTHEDLQRAIAVLLAKK
jgi:two-component system cell cycle sensor histidine kinase/response regulator CckA